MKKNVLLFLIFNFLFFAVFAHTESAIIINVDNCEITERWIKLEELKNTSEYIPALYELQSYIQTYPYSLKEIEEFSISEKDIFYDLNEQIIKLLNLLNDEKDINSREVENCKLQILNLISLHQSYNKAVAEYKNNKLVRLVSILILLLALFICISLFLNFSYSNSKKKNVKEKKYNDYILKIQESERKRISHELHDTVAQELRSIKFFTGEMIINKTQHKEISDELVKKADDVTAKAISNIRYICYNLTPPELECKKISDALGNLCSSFSEETGISCPLVITDTELLNSFSIKAQINIFRTIQEALENIKKHSQAKESSIVIKEKEQNNIEILICDDGIGFDVKKIQSQNTKPEETHFGIFGMIDRINSMNGTIIFSSNEELGTEIKITIPLERIYG